MPVRVDQHPLAAVYDSLHHYNPASRSWNDVNGTGEASPSARLLASMAVTNGCLFVVGGYDLTGDAIIIRVSVLGLPEWTFRLLGLYSFSSFGSSMGSEFTVSLSS